MKITDDMYMSLDMIKWLVGGVVLLVVWGVSLEARVSEHVFRDDKEAEVFKQDLANTQKLFYSIDKRLSRIEDRMGIKQ